MSILSSTPAGIELTPRSLLAPPDVGITGLDLKPKRVSIGRCIGKLGGTLPIHAPSAFGLQPFKNQFIKCSVGTGGGGVLGLVGSSAGIA